MLSNAASVATLRVVLDNLEVLPGSQISGKVYLSVNQDEISCNAICFCALGQEFTTVAERHVFFDVFNFIDHRRRLYTCPKGKIESGHYEYPFMFHLPANISASMKTVAFLASDCRIAYSVEAWLDRPGFIRWSIHHQQFFKIYLPAPIGRMVPIYMEPRQIPVHSFCCIRRGDVSMGGAAESNVVSAGGEVCVKYALQNHSRVPIKAVEVSVVENVMWDAQGHSCQRKVKWTKRYTPEEAGLTEALRPVLDGTPALNVRALRETLESEQFKINFKLPTTLHNSYSGNLIRVRHYLEIKMITPFGSNNPTIKHPIKVFSCGQPDILPVAAAERKHRDHRGRPQQNPIIPVTVPEARAVAHAGQDDSSFVAYAPAPLTQ